MKTKFKKGDTAIFRNDAHFPSLTGQEVIIMHVYDDGACGIRFKDAERNMLARPHELQRRHREE